MSVFIVMATKVGDFFMSFIVDRCSPFYNYAQCTSKSSVVVRLASLVYRRPFQFLCKKKKKDRDRIIIESEISLEETNERKMRETVNGRQREKEKDSRERKRGKREVRKGKRQFESLTYSLIDGRKRSQVLIGHDEKTNA